MYAIVVRVPFICYFETNWKSIVYAYFFSSSILPSLFTYFNKETKNMELTSVNWTFPKHIDQWTWNS